MKRTCEWLLVKPNYSRSHQCFGDASVMRRPPRTAAGVEYKQLEPRRQATKGRAGEVTQAFGGAGKVVSWIADIEPLEFGFCFCL